MGKQLFGGAVLAMCAWSVWSVFDYGSDAPKRCIAAKNEARQILNSGVGDRSSIQGARNKISADCDETTDDQAKRLDDQLLDMWWSK